MKFVLGLVVILGLAMVSQATFTETLGTITVDVTVDTTAPPSAGLTAYIFHVSSADLVGGIDGRIDAVGSTYLNQVWAGASQTGKTPLADPDGNWGMLANPENDTNVMLTPGQMLAVYAPVEDKAAKPSTHGTYLAGTNLSPGDVTMAFSTKSDPGEGYPLDLTSYDLTRVVVPNDLTTVQLTVPTGKYVRWHFNLADRQADPYIGNFDIYLAVPEPMTLSLLGAGALALIRRRR